MQKLENLSRAIFLGLLAYMPLHILVSTWVGTSFGVLPLMKILKDIVLVIGFALILRVSIKKKWFASLVKEKLLWIIGLYALLHIVLAVIRPVDTDAEVLGLVYNLRFLLFFVYALLLARVCDRKKLQRSAVRIVVTVACLVLVFGIVQYVLLPDNALVKIGYSRDNGVLPAFHIDDKPDLERVMSTVRDPNSLGSYVIIVGMLACAILLTTKRYDVRRIAIGLLLLSILCLLFTFSRSAWIGFALATVALVIMRYRAFMATYWVNIVAILAAVIVVGSGLFYVFRNSYLVQNVVFHADSSTTLEDPNQLRVRFLRESVDDIVRNPIGYGPGTAGLASIRNDVQGTKLNENYYLQIAHEVGLIGLLLFVSIVIMVGRSLWWEVEHNPTALALLAALIGISFTNLLVHIWANEAVAYTWWGLAGLVILYKVPKLK